MTRPALCIRWAFQCRRLSRRPEERNDLHHQLSPPLSAVIRGPDRFRFWARRNSRMVESRCGAVALGRTYLLPPLSFGGASMVPPWLRLLGMSEYAQRFAENRIDFSVL